MEWIQYVLLGLIPAVAAFLGGVCLAAAMVAKEHIEDFALLKKLAEDLANKDNPLTPAELQVRIEKIKIELGESKAAWKKLIEEFKELTRR